MYLLRVKWTATYLTLFLLGACGSEAVPFGDTPGLICPDQGFCLTVNNGTLFYGAFRVDEDELRFQIAKGSVNFLSPWIGGGRLCGRLLTDENHVFVDLASCREEWEDHFEPRSVYRREVYEGIARELLLHIKTTEAPTDCQDEWRLLEELLNSFLISTQEPQHDADTSAAMPQRTVNSESDAAPTGQRPNQSLNAPASGGEFGTSQQGLGWFGRYFMHDGDKISIAQRKERPGWEFRQMMQIWAQKADSIPGWEFTRTNSDHSSVFVIVEGRPSDGSLPWTKVDTFFSRNHGARPGEGRMRLAQNCGFDQFPITYNSYLVGGECEGGWLGRHVCNDDTTYQVASAHGICLQTNRHGEGKCPVTHRWNAPGCERPPW